MVAFSREKVQIIRSGRICSPAGVPLYRVIVRFSNTRPEQFAGNLELANPNVMLPDYYRKYDVTKSFFELMAEVEDGPTRMMTIWIPLDHKVNDQDKDDVRKFGELLEPILKPYRIGHSATSCDMEKIGLVIAGLILNEDARLAIIPTLKKYCPQQTIFSIQEIVDGRDKDEITEWPLFEAGEKAECERFFIP